MIEADQQCSDHEIANVQDRDHDANDVDSWMAMLKIITTRQKRRVWQQGADTCNKAGVIREPVLVHDRNVLVWQCDSCLRDSRATF